MNNFDFFKTVDKNLYEIITDAEKLYRDEYFEQCIGQTRRFGENVCKNVLGNKRTSEKTFDDMLATLKDMSSNEEQEKEFLEDLYFLKREGNASVHGGNVKKDGMVALECLQRAFEIAISYALYKGNYDKKYDLLKIRYDTEMLITGKKTKQTLAEKYAEEKARNSRTKTSKNTTKKTNNKAKQAYTLKVKDSSEKSLFKVFVIFSAIVSTILCLIICLLTVI